jgi:4-amino-4-deoxychorismate lyase
MQLIETIRFEQGKFSNLIFHQNRMDNSRKMLFNCKEEINLPTILQEASIEISDKGLYKCRVIYNSEITKIEFIPYNISDIKSLKLVSGDDIDYSHKYLDRMQINKLLTYKGSSDDIIIVKKGLVTDSSNANLLFYNGKKWLTPAMPLLVGTQRTKLIKQEKIQVADIRSEDLHNFQKVRLINAMLRFEDELDVPSENIKTF